MTQLQKNFSTTSLCAFIGLIQVSETSWFIAHCGLACTYSEASPAGTFFYGRPRTCVFTGRTTTIINANGDVGLKGWFNCTVACVVYVVTRQRCYKLYIGETDRRFADHFGEHLRSVEGFKQEPRYLGVGSPLPNTLIYLNITKSTTCECLW